MFVRKKKNKSGIISIQVIAKQDGKSKLIKTIGSSLNKNEIEGLYNQGKEFIKSYGGQQSFNFKDAQSIAESILKNITSHKEVGTGLLLGKIFTEIGFNKIPDALFRHLVFARLSYPVSKLKTSDYLNRYKEVDIPVQKIYRYLDKLYIHQKEQIQQISYQHTLKVLNGVISVVFYDVTTLYFQIDEEDELRKRGFSKEGKHQNPQIILGLLVSVDGYPLAYEIHEGNKFEGHTMLPIIDSFKSKYSIDKLIIIADSGLLSTNNIHDLQTKGYEFILGARIKNESTSIKEKILSLNLKNGQSDIIEKNDTLKIIVSHSDKRAKKDKYNRERGLQKLEKQIQSGKLTKANINNRGYNKYLKMNGKINVSIDIEKFKNDAKWDGIKGYITNTSLPKNEIIENYSHLWKIEKAFRVSKHDLKVRPIYHRIRKRIEAHITINFVAYKVYKELERQLKAKNATISPEKAIDIAKTIFQIQVEIENNKQITKTLLLTDNQKYLAELFGFG
jgi:transposase